MSNWLAPVHVGASRVFTMIASARVGAVIIRHAVSLPRYHEFPDLFSDIRIRDVEPSIQIYLDVLRSQLPEERAQLFRSHLACRFGRLKNRRH